MSEFNSPTPSNVDVSGLPPSITNNVRPRVEPGLMPDHFTIRCVNTLYNTTTDPLICSPLMYGALFMIKNEQVTAIKAIGVAAGDPGVTIQAGATVLVGTDGAGNLILLGGTSGGAFVFYLPPLSPVGDDGANITAALASGDVYLLPNAVYTISTPIDVSATPEKTLNVNGAILKGNMAPTGGTANSVIKSVPTIAGTGNTTLTANATVGDDQLTVAAVAGALVLNAFIRVRSVANAALQTIYQVLRVNGLVLTTDRPILEPFLNTDIVEVVSVMPHDTKIYGPGTITGSGDRGIDLQGMRRGLVTDLKVDVSILGLAAATLSGGIIFDLSCVECVGERNECVGRNTTTNTDVFDVSLGMFSAELSRFVGCQGRRATTAGVFLKDAYRCVVRDTDGTDCTSGTATGLAVSATAAATGSASTDCSVEGGSYSNNVFGFGTGTVTRLRTKGMQILDSATRCMDIGSGGLVSTDCQFDDTFIKGAAPTTTAILINVATVNVKFKNLQIEGITGAAQLFQSQAPVSVDGLTCGPTNTTTGNWIEVASADGENYLTRLRITGKTVNASMNMIVISGAASRNFFRDHRIAVGVAGDIVYRHTGLAIVELDDVEVTNPGVVAGTSGYLAGGASSLLRRKGRVNMSATATPYTLVQSDQGTFTANNAVAVPVLFKDAVAAGMALVELRTAAGTPGLPPQQTMVAATRVDFTAVNLDTSVYSYKILD